MSGPHILRLILLNVPATFGENRSSLFHGMWYQTHSLGLQFLHIDSMLGDSVCGSLRFCTSQEQGHASPLSWIVFGCLWNEKPWKVELASPSGAEQTWAPSLAVWVCPGSFASPRRAQRTTAWTTLVARPPLWLSDKLAFVSGPASRVCPHQCNCGSLTV